MFLRTTNFMDK